MKITANADSSVGVSEVDVKRLVHAYIDKVSDLVMVGQLFSKSNSQFIILIE